MSSRRSPREPARVKVNFSKSRMKDARLSKSVHQNDVSSENWRNSLNGLVPGPSRNNKLDKYCWICHQLVNEENEEDERVCKECPRIYHVQCLPVSHQSQSEEFCMECKMVSVDGTGPIVTYDKPLSKFLMIILNQIIKKYKVFKVWPGETHRRNSEVAYEMELALLRDRIKNEDYKSTAKFFSDVKWIYHNSHIVFGAKDTKTTKAKALQSEMKTQLMDLEACVDCFYALNTDESNFVKLCHNVHELVWIKLKGHPYWPAKVLKTINKKSHVVYFGSHERSKVCVADCYPLSKENPGGKLPKKESYYAAVEELELHIEYHKERFNKFTYAETSKKRSLPAGRKSRRKRMKTGESQHNMSSTSTIVPNSSEISMISDSEVTSSMDNTDCILIDESADVVVLFDHSPQRIPISVAPSPAATVTTDRVAQYSEIPGVEMEFSIGECSQMETLNFFNDLTPRSSDDDTPENVVHSLLEGILEGVASTRNDNVQFGPDPNTEMHVRRIPGRSEPVQQERLSSPVSRSYALTSSLSDEIRDESSRLSQVSYDNIMNRFRPMIRVMCNEFANMTYNTRITHLKNLLVKSRQENESLRVKNRQIAEEKREMKESADHLVNMLDRKLSASERKRGEAETLVRHLKILLAEKEADEEVKRSSHSDVAEETPSGVPSSSNSSLTSASTQTEVDAVEVGVDAMPLQLVTTPPHCLESSISVESVQTEETQSSQTIPDPEIVSFGEVTLPSSTCHPVDNEDENSDKGNALLVVEEDSSNVVEYVETQCLDSVVSLENPSVNGDIAASEEVQSSNVSSDDVEVCAYADV